MERLFNLNKVEKFLKDDQTVINVVLATNYSMEDFVKVLNNAYTEDDYKNGKDMVILHESFNGMDLPSLKGAKKTLERYLEHSNDDYKRGVEDSIRVLSKYIKNYSMKNIDVDIIQSNK